MYHGEFKIKYGMNDMRILVAIVCILVAIKPQIKEAYLRRQHDTKEQLIKYYMVMVKIQI